MAAPAMSRLPVLMYHGLHDGPAPGAKAAPLHARRAALSTCDAEGGDGNRLIDTPHVDNLHFDAVYSVAPDAFARHLDALLADGWHTVLSDAADAQRGARALVISFDDGDLSNRTVALPALLARGMVAEFFITSDFIGQPGMLTAADVRALADAGMGIGGHGRSHAFLEDLDADALAAELRESRARLSAIIGRPVTSMALPGGRGGDREHAAALDAGYRSLYGSVPGINRGARDDTWRQRIAVTRGTAVDDVLAMVNWRGLRPRIARARFTALSWPKRLLGNARYQRLREALL